MRLACSPTCFLLLPPPVLAPELGLLRPQVGGESTCQCSSASESGTPRVESYSLETNPAIDLRPPQVHFPCYSSKFSTASAHPVLSLLIGKALACSASLALGLALWLRCAANCSAAGQHHGMAANMSLGLCCALLVLLHMI